MISSLRLILPIPILRISVAGGLLFTVAGLHAEPVAVGGNQVQKAPAGTVDFVRDIQPIFSQHCYECHGGKMHEGGLRWDRRASVLKGGDSGEPAVVPGEPKKSLLLKLVRGGEDEIMPPAGKGRPLSDEQIALLTRWIADGAVWPDAVAEPAAPKHWAFVKPVRPKLPEVKQPDWPRDPLDRFVLARLERKGLAPSPVADKYLLVRRVYLDLIGIGPTPEQADAFVNDPRPDAYVRLVDGLLASPHFGERWARVWLDLARYADTQGYEKDNKRTIWRYRDWVIDALNRDLPYDQFTIEQLAGDLLPNPTYDQIVATAFHRNTMTNTEGGTDDEEWRTAAVVDRTNTTAQVWMGLTMGCAQCHSHKYDPITQRDYYQFYAFLNQTEDSDKDDERPTMAAPKANVAPEVAKIDAKLLHLQQKLGESTIELLAGQRKWERELAGTNEAAKVTFGAWQSIGPFTAENFDTAHEKPFAPETDLDLTKALDNLKWEARPQWKDGEVHVLGGRTSAYYVARTITASAPTRVALGLGSDDGIKVWHDGELVLDHKISRGAAPDQERVAINVPAGESRLLLKISNNGANAGFIFRTISVGLPEELVAILKIPDDQRSRRQQRELSRFYRQIAPELADVRREIALLMQQRAKLLTAAVSTPILRELPADKRRKTHILIRGNFLSKGAEVQPGVPEAFPPLPASAPANRLGMAQWLVNRDNPLSARVAVNRFWEKLFGTGLVQTSEDFGTQGTSPTHPELLDYLAVEFMDQGYSMKQLLRRLVLSATYRQSSRVLPQLAARDPENKLLARGPRFRLEAETVRDQALAVAGLLSEKMHGPSVMPPQPDGVWQVVYSGDNWVTSKGEDRYRRGLYTFWRRTSPYPSMMAFDATSREVCTVRRIRTNTPLAALVTLNDPVYVEAAQALAVMTLEQGGATPPERVTYAFRRCLVRPPSTAEMARLMVLYETELKRFQADLTIAQKIAVGTAELPKNLDVAQLAAWTVVGNVLLNLDETLTKM